MPSPRARIDDIPFEAPRLGEALGMTPTPSERSAAHRERRERIDARAQHHGFPVTDGPRGAEIVGDVDGVVVRVPLHAVTMGTAVLTARSAAAGGVTLSVEPRTLLHRLLSSGVPTGDDAFDARWTTTTPDPSIAPKLLDENARRALRDAKAWVRASYDDGRIEVTIDAEDMCGARLLDGMRVAAALARSRTSSSPFR